MHVHTYRSGPYGPRPYGSGPFWAGPLWPLGKFSSFTPVPCPKQLMSRPHMYIYIYLHMYIYMYICSYRKGSGAKRRAA